MFNLYAKRFAEQFLAAVFIYRLLLGLLGLFRAFHFFLLFNLNRHLDTFTDQIFSFLTASNSQNIWRFNHFKFVGQAELQSCLLQCKRLCHSPRWKMLAHSRDEKGRKCMLQIRLSHRVQLQLGALVLIRVSLVPNVEILKRLPCS